MKKTLLLLCVVVSVTGCSSSKYCVAENMEQKECTKFNGESGSGCNAHVNGHDIKVEKK